MMGSPSQNNALHMEVSFNSWGCSWKPPVFGDDVTLAWEVFNLLTEKSQAQRGPDAAWHIPGSGVLVSQLSSFPGQQGGLKKWTFR